jgi:dGTPase
VIQYPTERVRRRLETPDPNPAEDPRSRFEHDRDRILHSGAFRRLQGKTQVVSPGGADLFRTRMTHTLECAQIGRALAVRLGADAALVEAACMAHDLGHPPFGHTGEVALQTVMEGHGGFEGNAQSFRIVSRLEAKTRGEDLQPYGLNLTAATLDGTLKYPWAEGQEPAQHYADKFGYYLDDEEAFHFARDGRPGTGQSFEASLMDWADDVAYAVHDLEDGIRAGLVPMNFLRQDRWAVEQVAVKAVELQKENPRFSLYGQADQADMLQGFLQREWFDWASRDFDGSVEHKIQVKRMSSELINYFITSVDPEQHLEPGQAVHVPEEVQLENRLLNAIVFRYIIDPPGLATLQFGQRRVVELLFEAYRRDERLLPPAERDELHRAGHDEARCRRVVCDHVAGMTDRYAHRMFDRLYGGGKGSVGDIL